MLLWNLKIINIILYIALCAWIRYVCAVREGCLIKAVIAFPTSAHKGQSTAHIQTRGSWCSQPRCIIHIEHRMNRKQNEYRKMNPNQQTSAIPVRFCDYKDSVMRVAWISWVPTMHSWGTFCFKPRGIIWVESTQIRSFLRWSGGEAGPVEPQVSRDQESQN
jgi:hypothetical protein